MTILSFSFDNNKTLKYMTIKFIKGKLCIIENIDFLSNKQTLITPIMTYLQFRLGYICVRFGSYLMNKDVKGKVI